MLNFVYPCLLGNKSFVILGKGNKLELHKLLPSMAASTGSSNASPAPLPPKILLAKPGLVTGGPVTGKFGRGDDDTASHRSRLPPIGSLNLLSDSWDFHIDRFLPVLSLSFCATKQNKAPKVKVPSY